MNKVVNLNNIGGFPFTQGTLDFMQKNYESAFEAVARLAGNKVILSGVDVVGSLVSSGWISYNGEILPFVGGGLTNDVFIEETKITKDFQDGAVYDAYVTRVVKLGTPGDFPFADLKRLNTLKEIWLPGDLKQVICDANYIAANFNVAGIGINERKGWKICDEMGGRIAVGYSTVTIDPGDNVWDAIYNTIGATEGKKKQTLLKANLPHDKIPVIIGSAQTSTTSGGSPGYGRIVGGSDGTEPTGITGVTTDFLGDGTAFDIRQPFKVILYIEKI